MARELREDHYRWRDRRELLDVCLEVHMNNTGSSDCSSDEEIDSMVEWLEYRLIVWADNCGRPIFDEAVRTMVTIAILEGRETIRKRQERME